MDVSRSLFLRRQNRDKMRQDAAVSIQAGSKTNGKVEAGSSPKRRWPHARLKYIDLHSHSNFSDGTDSPTELIRKAEAQGLAALALTDHNTAAGLSEFTAAAAQSPVEAVGGTEFSTDFGPYELHIVGLFIAPERAEDVRRFAEPLAQRKIESNLALEKALQQVGYDISLAEMMAGKPGNGQINRADFAAELLRKGYMDFETSFSTVLSKKGGLYREPRRLDVMETVDFIRSIEAVPVLAHPYLSMPPDQVDRFLDLAVGRGLGAMEVYYPTYDAETEALAEKTAARYGIAKSGGSDYHGSRKPDTSLGTGTGRLHIPAELLEILRAA